MRLIIVTLLCFYFPLQVFAAFNPSESIHINTAKTPSVHVEVVVKIENDLSEDITFCWAQKVKAQTDFCLSFPKNTNQFLKTTVGTKWKVSLKTSKSDFMVEIFGGQHIFTLSKLQNYPQLRKEALERGKSKIAYVRSPNGCMIHDPSGWDVLGPTWRDAVRVAAYRHNVSLCFCGEYNSSTSYMVDLPNPELPFILDGDACECDAPHTPIDFWIPCTYGVHDPGNLLHGYNCNESNLEHGIYAADSYLESPYENEFRVLFIHSTVQVDRLSMKSKMWESLKRVYGEKSAAYIMPQSFHSVHSTEEWQALWDLCHKIVESGMNEKQVFVMKDESLHQQKGITISTAQSIINKALGIITAASDTYTNAGSGDHHIAPSDHGAFAMATIFLADPFIVKGYKINMRRYMVAVCTGGRLRGYVHDDGKNIYSAKPYREPWVGEPWEGKKAAILERLQEMITTGYVPETHFLDKPLSGIEFFNYVRDDLGLDPTLLQKSMWTRLALSLYASTNDGYFDLCDTRPHNTNTEAVPWCLEGAVRFQHFGCDFHIDAALNGFDSRLFECNKGPDMSIHSYRDGKMKRDVAADIASFIGLNGPFNGTAAHAKKFRMNLIYDSNYFDVDGAFRFLNSLKDSDVRVKNTSPKHVEL